MKMQKRRVAPCLFLLIFLLLLSWGYTDYCRAQCVSPPHGFIHWWPADGNVQDVVGANDGELRNGAGFATGKVGEAFSFDGDNDYFEASEYIGITGNRPRTICAWIKPSYTYGSSCCPVPLAWGEHYGGASFGIFISSGIWWFWGYLSDINTGFPVTLDWSHHCISYDGFAVRYYINGNLEASAPKQLNTSDTPLSLGNAFNKRIDTPFGGLVDEVVLFDRALFSPEIQFLYTPGNEELCIPPEPYCGDGICLPASESTLSCAEDCGGLCPTESMAGWWPGNGNGEDNASWADGVLRDGATFAPAVVEQGFSFNGVNSHVEILNTPFLENVQEGNFTLEAWFKPNSVPPGDNTNNVKYGILVKRGYHTALTYNQYGKFQMEHHFSDNSINFVTSTSAYSPGQFYHVVATVDRTAGMTKIYVNGEPQGVSTFTPGKPSFEYGVTTWKIGIAAPSAGSWRWAADGVVDEAVIYDGVLSDSEILAHYQAGSDGLCTLPTLKITTQLLPATKLNEFVSHQFEAASGTPPYSWSLVDGTLPPGMEFSSTGILSGTPTEGGTFTFTVRVTDSATNTAEKAFEKKILITSPPPKMRVKKFGTKAVPGRIIDYFILVENLGEETVTDWLVVEFLEPWFTFISADPAPTEIINGEELHWNIGSLAPGERIIISYQVQLSPTFPESEELIPMGFEVSGTACLAMQQECFNDLRNCKRNCYDECGEIWISFAKNMCLTKCMGDVCTPTFQACLASYGFGEGQPCYSHTQPVQRPIDPNEKGHIGETFIQLDQTLFYPVHFENVGEEVEAQDIFITDVLDSDLDLSTVEALTPNGTFVPLPADVSVTIFEMERTRTVIVDGSPVEIPYVESWDATLNSATRTITWQLLNIYLEPGATGSVTFSVNPSAGLPSGTEIRNEAYIQFEIFEVITTNEVLNIIDSTPPNCVMDVLPEEVSTLNFPISWSGVDTIGEIASYSIFVSVDGGSFMPFLEKTTDKSAAFTGEAEKNYGFICVATDTAGNTEVQDPVVEASTLISPFAVRNEPPIAVAGGPYTGNSEFPISFYATGSYDPDGDIVLYEWDWDNDGIYEVSTTSLAITHTWNAPYIGVIKLRVTDNEGLSAGANGFVKVCVAGDFDGDSDVDGSNLALFAQAYGNSENIADLNGDGVLNHGDIQLFSEKFGCVACINP